MESISAALDELYGVRIEPIVRKKGEIHCIGLYADFPDDRYLSEGGSVLEKAIGITFDVLLDPYFNDGLLCPNYIESEKSNLIDEIRAAINDKAGYSVNRLLEEMCSTEAFGVSNLGSEAEALEITASSLTAHYYDLIKNSHIEIFYCGSAESGRIETALKAALTALPERTPAEIPSTKIVYKPRTDKPRRFTEELDVTQGKLTVGFRLGDAMTRPDYPALMMLNAIYGGSISSKLFLNVREKLSLCYYASSMLDKHKGIMLVASGVEFSKFEVALDEILVQLEKVKNGDISDWEFTAAKRSIVTSTKSALDRQGGLEELYFDGTVSSVSYDPVGLSDTVEAVTLERVIKCASDIKADSIYFLSGDAVTDVSEVSNEATQL